MLWVPVVFIDGNELLRLLRMYEREAQITEGRSEKDVWLRGVDRGRAETLREVCLTLRALLGLPKVGDLPPEIQPALYLDIKGNRYLEVKTAPGLVALLREGRPTDTWSWYSEADLQRMGIERARPKGPRTVGVVDVGRLARRRAR